MDFDQYDVLIGCEESGAVREAMIALGIKAVSCDLIPSRVPGPHYQDDVLAALCGRTQKWPLAIVHPDCTCLSVSGNRTYAKGKPGWSKRLKAIEWTTHLWHRVKQNAERGLLENPKGVLSTLGRMGTPQYIQPWQYGHGETKETGLWLHNLPELEPTDIVDGREQRIWKMGPGKNRKRDRSKTFTGIAAAFADQYGRLIHPETTDNKETP